MRFTPTPPSRRRRCGRRFARNTPRVSVCWRWLATRRSTTRPTVGYANSLVIPKEGPRPHDRRYLRTHGQGLVRLLHSQGGPDAKTSGPHVRAVGEHGVFGVVVDRRSVRVLRRPVGGGR